ncbi:MAG: hypothetical protein BWY88_00725 [Synergistetes bacterium ADurb.Bin520]|nr:MAG: hypothetical protein BWY88_00725 [Synergistetes bacterium ADurb.Bin520]
MARPVGVMVERTTGIRPRLSSLMTRTKGAAAWTSPTETAWIQRGWAFPSSLRSFPSSPRRSPYPSPYRRRRRGSQAAWTPRASRP